MEDKEPIDTNKLFEKINSMPLDGNKFHFTPFDIVNMMKHRIENPCREIIIDYVDMMKQPMTMNPCREIPIDDGLFTWEDYEKD